MSRTEASVMTLPDLRQNTEKCSTLCLHNNNINSRKKKDNERKKPTDFRKQFHSRWNTEKTLNFVGKTEILNRVFHPEDQYTWMIDFWKVNQKNLHNRRLPQWEDNFLQPTRLFLELYDEGFNLQ